jgi:hypothetical protein
LCKYIFSICYHVGGGGALEEKTTLLKIYTYDDPLFKCCDNYSVSILNKCVFKDQTVVSYVLVHNIYVNENVTEFRTNKYHDYSK